MRYLLATLMTASAFVAGPAFAQYPERPVQMIVAYSAGGGTDIAARTLAQFIEDELGTTVTVINRPGANGAVGFSALANASPDGYTIGFINTPSFFTNTIYPGTDYTVEDFQPISIVVSDPIVFAVRPDQGIETLADLVARAQETEGGLLYSSGGIGSDDHLAAMAFANEANVELTNVPFEGDAPAKAAALGGHVDFVVMNITQGVEAAQAGELVLLGQMSPERWEGASDTPTFAEQGFDLEGGSQRGLAAPAGLPDDVLKTLSAAVSAAMDNPEFLEAAEEQALPLRKTTPEEYSAFLATSAAQARELWEETPWAEQ